MTRRVQMMALIYKQGVPTGEQDRYKLYYDVFMTNPNSTIQPLVDLVIVIKSIANEPNVAYQYIGGKEDHHFEPFSI